MQVARNWLPIGTAPLIGASIPQLSMTPEQRLLECSPAQRRHAAHTSRVALDIDVRPHAPQFGHLHKTILENRFLHRTGTLGHAQQRHHLRLQVRGESRIRPRRYIRSPKTVARRNTHAGTAGAFGGTDWGQSSGGDRTEWAFIRTLIGKAAAGSETPTYSSTNFVTDGDSLETAIGDLDAEAQLNRTDTDSSTAKLADARTTAAANNVTGTVNVPSRSVEPVAAGTGVGADKAIQQIQVWRCGRYFGCLAERLPGGRRSPE